MPNPLRPVFIATILLGVRDWIVISHRNGAVALAIIRVIGGLLFLVFYLRHSKLAWYVSLAMSLLIPSVYLVFVYQWSHSSQDRSEFLWLYAALFVAVMLYLFYIRGAYWRYLGSGRRE
jgi:hypothetical protein